MAKSNTKIRRRDITAIPMEIVRSFTMQLEGDDHIRYTSEYPEFVNVPGPYLTESLGVFDSPAEFCLVTAMEFARRYPGHPNSKQRRNGFTNKEILRISKGEKKIIFKYFNHPEYDNYLSLPKYQKIIKRIAGLIIRPDFTKQPMFLRKSYEYWFEDDNLSDKPRGGVTISQFTNISLELAMNNGWVKDDLEYSIMCELEFCRRNPKDSYAKESQYFKLFSEAEILDITKGRKKLITKNCYEE